MGVELHRIGEDLRQARDSESAHLEAILKDDGPKALRLARLHDILRERSNAETLDFQAMAGLEPRLWLDLNSCVVMRPDAGTYQLSVHGQDRIETILETENLDEIVAECSRRLARTQVQIARSTQSAVPQVDTASPTTLVYIWMTGVFTGVAIFAVCAMLLKKMPF